MLGLFSSTLLQALAVRLDIVHMNTESALNINEIVTNRLVVQSPDSQSKFVFVAKDDTLNICAWNKNLRGITVEINQDAVLIILSRPSQSDALIIRCSDSAITISACDDDRSGSAEIVPSDTAGIEFRNGRERGTG